MASAPPPAEMEQEAMCPICLECLTDPVVLDCGHSFCQGCITNYCETWEALKEAPMCPTCKLKIQKGGFRRNWQLANLLEKMKPMPLSSGKEGLCLRHKEKLNLFCKEDKKMVCSVCERSPEHKGHTILPLEEAAQQHKQLDLQERKRGEAVKEEAKERICEKHQEPLKLFCQTDEILICTVCDRSKEHKSHEVVPADEAAQEYKDKIFNCLETLRIERQEILVYIADAEDESKEMLKRAESKRQKKVAEFRTLHQLLNELEKDLLAQIEETEKEIARKRDEHLARLSEELSSLESLIQEMEEKSQQPVTELPQDVRNTMQRYKEREKFAYQEAFPLQLKRRVHVCRYNRFLESAMKPFKDTLDWAFPKLRAKMTLDPASASPHLGFTVDQKSMYWKSTAEDVSADPEELCGFGLGCEGFTGGCHFWEVIVGNAEGWAVGVARKSVKDRAPLTPEEGIWAVGRWKGPYRENLFPLSGEPRLVRVCLNYDAGRVAFFDTYRAALLYEFSGASFSGETLYPFFAVYNGNLDIYP